MSKVHPRVKNHSLNMLKSELRNILRDRESFCAEITPEEEFFYEVEESFDDHLFKLFGENEYYFTISSHGIFNHYQTHNMEYRLDLELYNNDAVQLVLTSTIRPEHIDYFEKFVTCSDVQQLIFRFQLDQYSYDYFEYTLEDEIWKLYKSNNVVLETKNFIDVYNILRQEK